MGKWNSLIILGKCFVQHHRDIQHTGGTIKIVLLENAKMFQSEMALTEILLLVTKREKIDI